MDHSPNNESLVATDYEMRMERLDRERAWGNRGIGDHESEELVPMRWEEVNKLKFPEMPWRIKNLVPLQGLTILSAVSGGKKSWMALEMARSICQGIDFLDREEFATRKGKVLYVDCENPKSEIQRRGRQLQFTSEDDFFVLSRDSLNLNDDLAVLDLKGLIDFYKIDTVIIDTFRAVAGALKEDKAEEVREYFNRFKPLKDRGVSVIFLDHFRKPSNFDGKVPKKEFLLGSQDKTASVEVLLMLHSESGSNEISFYQRKNRLGREINPFKISMIDKVQDDNIHTVFSHLGEIADEVNKKEEAKELVLNLLGTVDGMSSTEVLTSLQKQVGQKNVRKALQELVKEGVVDCSRMGKQNYYLLPKNGSTASEEPIPSQEKDFFDDS